MLIVHGLPYSYFTGKLEGYLRAKGIAYRLVEMDTADWRRCGQATGVYQMPQLDLGDGRWMTDSTVIIDHFESQPAGPSLTPADATARFIAWLIEDYADEWLWRPAMHYRWSYRDSAALMSSWLATSILRDVPLPLAVRKLMIRRRQLKTFVIRDGVNAATRDRVEHWYLDNLDALEGVLRRRPYVLGERPTRADIGLFGPMFRHFASDPTPARIMRERAPAVLEWLARLWRGEPDRFQSASQASGVPADLAALAKSIAEDFLPYLAANAAAYACGAQRVQWSAAATAFVTPTSPYRVWRYDRLLARAAELDQPAQAQVTNWLGADGAALLSAPRPARLPPLATGRPRDSQWHE